jgi:hypothetical protein
MMFEKMMKHSRFFCLILLAGVAMGLVSCLDKGGVSMTVNYTVGVVSSRFEGLDTAVVRAYLSKNGCPYSTTQNFDGETLIECDTLCMQTLRDYAKTLSTEALDSLALSDSCRFIFGASRQVNPFSGSNGSNKLAIIKAFEYKRGDGK